MAFMKETKIQRHHIFFIRSLRRKAQEFSRCKVFTEQHRKECKNEAKLFAEIENFLEANYERD